MRILVVSDVHGNWPALAAVGAVPHDAVICLGDIVGYGPEPAACLRWLRNSKAEIVQGNHDRALARDEAPRCRGDFEWLALASCGIGRQQLEDEEKAYLRGLPPTRCLLVDGRRLLLVHATPRDPLYGYLGPERERWRALVAGLAADIVLVGHTHVPCELHFEGIQVVNPGSVGQPKDGDPRAAYALIEDGVPRLERVSYPVQRTIEAFGRAKIDAAAGAELSRLLRTGRVASRAP